MQSDTLIIIPTYNESRNISKMIPVLMQLDNLQTDVLVVDDGSPDGTADVVRGFQKEYEGRVHLITRAGKLGLDRLCGGVSVCFGEIVQFYM